MRLKKYVQVIVPTFEVTGQPHFLVDLLVSCPPALW